MKLVANVEFHKPEGDTCRCNVNVDADYVEDNANSILEYISNELYEMFGHSFDYDDFKVMNMQEIIEDLKPAEED